MTCNSGIQLTLNYHSAAKTNATATPVLRRIAVRNVALSATKSYLECDGLSDSRITGVTFENVTVTGTRQQSCGECDIRAAGVHPAPKCG